MNDWGQCLEHCQKFLGINVQWTFSWQPWSRCCWHGVVCGTSTPINVTGVCVDLQIHWFLTQQSTVPTLQCLHPPAQICPHCRREQYWIWPRRTHCQIPVQITKKQLTRCKGPNHAHALTRNRCQTPCHNWPLNLQHAGNHPPELSHLLRKCLNPGWPLKIGPDVITYIIYAHTPKQVWLLPIHMPAQISQCMKKHVLCIGTSWGLAHMQEIIHPEGQPKTLISEEQKDRPQDIVKIVGTQTQSERQASPDIKLSFPGNAQKLAVLSSDWQVKETILQINSLESICHLYLVQNIPYSSLWKLGNVQKIVDIPAVSIHPKSPWFLWCRLKRKHTMWVSSDSLQKALLTQPLNFQCHKLLLSRSMNPVTLKRLIGWSIHKL